MSSLTSFRATFPAHLIPRFGQTGGPATHRPGLVSRLNPEAFLSIGVEGDVLQSNFAPLQLPVSHAGFSVGASVPWNPPRSRTWDKPGIEPERVEIGWALSM